MRRADACPEQRHVSLEGEWPARRGDAAGRPGKSDTRTECQKARMASSSAPNELALLLQRVVTVLPTETQVLVLRHLPAVELARLSCVHKAFRVAWRSLQEKHPGRRYAPPSAEDFDKVEGHPRLERAGMFGDVAVIWSMFAAGVDEHGTPLLLARDSQNNLVLDAALVAAVNGDRLQAVELLIENGADLHVAGDTALRFASYKGYAEVVQLLIQHGAVLPSRGDVEGGDADEE